MLMIYTIRKPRLIFISLILIAAVFYFVTFSSNEEKENILLREELIELMIEEKGQQQISKDQEHEDEQKETASSYDDLYSDTLTINGKIKYPSDEALKWMNSAEKIEAWKRLQLALDEEPQSKRQPDVIGIGVEKCGTGALAKYLSEHPMVKARIPMEAHFFEGLTPKSFDDYINSMPLSGTSSLVFEKTPAYFSFPPAQIPETMKDTIDDVKILVILCNPSRRVFSDFVQETITGAIPPRTFRTVEDYLLMYEHRFKEYSKWKSHDELISLRNAILRIHTRDYLSTILTTGFYALHLSRWLEVFDSSQIHVIDGDKMLEDPGSILEKVQTFLGLPKLITSQNFVRDTDTGFFCFKRPTTEQLSCLNEGKTRTRMGKMNISESTLKTLNELYQPFNEKLFEMIDTEFDWS